MPAMVELIAGTARSYDQSFPPETKRISRKYFSTCIRRAKYGKHLIVFMAKIVKYRNRSV